MERTASVLGLDWHRRCIAIDAVRRLTASDVSWPDPPGAQSERRRCRIAPRNSDWSTSHANAVAEAQKPFKARVAEVLRDVEFQAGSDINVCPSCWKTRGHYEDCALAALLKEEPGVRDADGAPPLRLGQQARDHAALGH